MPRGQLAIFIYILNRLDYPKKKKDCILSLLCSMERVTAGRPYPDLDIDYRGQFRSAAEDPRNSHLPPPGAAAITIVAWFMLEVSTERNNIDLPRRRRARCVVEVML
ncbi:hypothetical protein C0Q70_19915 [Pomacea canaliculata]|uniref:Uncharacterized protein n=1 Tax=Pomacea canaliculata TaxID=400727 RepID=A0A2T7NE34_POMCA|nr:hypothetical protein C0Q70_19915 [Pomacea canaliculata]